MEPESEREPTAEEAAGMDWWNVQSDLVREFWVRVANSARPADAWAAYRFAMMDEATNEPA